MNWKKTKVFSSFGVIGCIVDEIMPNNQKQILLYDATEIRIYQIDVQIQYEITFNINLIDTINLFTRIKQIVLIQSQQNQHCRYLVVLNDLGQMSAISPTYPYEHKVLTLPEHFNQNLSMTASKNKLNIIVSQESELCIFEINQKQEFISYVIDLTRVLAGKLVQNPLMHELVQVETTYDGGLYLLSHSYDAHNENNMIVNMKTGFMTSHGIVKSTVQHCKLSALLQSKHRYFAQTSHFPVVALQILPLEQESVLILTNRVLFCTKNDQQEFNLFFQQELPPNAFMKLVYSTKQVLVCYQSIIEIVQLTFDYFGQLINVESMQQVNCTPGINEIVVSSFIEELTRPITLVWIQTEQGACYLSYIQEKARPNQVELEPQVQKKVKIDDYEYAIKIITHIHTFKKIFNFTIMQNTLFMLSGNAIKQQITKVQHEVHLTKNDILNKSIMEILIKEQTPHQIMIFQDGTIAIQRESLSFYRVNSENSIQLLEQLEMNIHSIYKHGILLPNFNYIYYDTTLLVFALNPLKIIMQPTLILSDVKQYQQYFVGKDPEGHLSLGVVDLGKQDITTTRIKELCGDYSIINADQYDMTIYQGQLLILVIGNQTLLILQLDTGNYNPSLKLVFTSKNYLQNVPVIVNGADCNMGRMVSSTCPSVSLQHNGNLEIRSETLIESSIISFHRGNLLSLMFLFENGRLIFYTLNQSQDYPKMHAFKLLNVYNIGMQQNTQMIHKITIHPNQIVLPRLNLVLTEFYGDMQLHFTRKESTVLINTIQINRIGSTIKDTYLVSQNNQFYLLPAFLLTYQPSNPTVQTIITPSSTNIERGIRSSCILLSSFNFNAIEYLVVVNKLSFPHLPRQFKNEILIYKANQLQTPFTEYLEIENEEIIKISYMPMYELIVVMTASYPMQQTYLNLMEMTKVHLLRLDQYSKLTELEYKSIKDSIPCDLAILTPYQSILVATQDQLKFFDPPPKARNSNLIALSLQANESQRISITHYEAVVAMDRWIAVLNGGFKVVICKLAEDMNQPKSEYVVEFGVNGNDKLLDIQLFKIRGRPSLSILDELFNLHIYTLSIEKNKLKKVADCFIPDPCRIQVISDKLLISTTDGNIYLLEQDENDDNQQMLRNQNVIEELPYVGGFSPANCLYARNHPLRRHKSTYPTKGCVWDNQINQVFYNLSTPLQQAIESRNRVPQEQNIVLE